MEQERVLRKQRYRYHKRTFLDLHDMIKNIFPEVEKQLQLLENEEIENIRMNRREIKWKLLTIGSFQKEKEFSHYLFQYNHYWSRLYYLEHVSEDENRYLKSLRQKLLALGKFRKN